MKQRSRNRPSKTRAADKDKLRRQSDITSSDPISKRRWTKVILGGIVGLAVIAGVTFVLPERSDREPAQGSPGAASDSDQAVDSATRLPVFPGLEEHRFDSVVRTVATREDPVLDGWESERFNELAGAQLKKIGKMLSDPDHLDQVHASQVTSDSFAGTRIRPAVLREVFTDKSLSVRRAADSKEGGNLAGKEKPQEPLKGPSGLLTVLRQQAEPLVGLTDIRFKFKIIRVSQDDGSAVTTSYFQISGRNDQQAVQVNATWTCHWLTGDGDAAPTLTGIDVQDYEEVVYRQTRGPMFADCTESVFRNTDRFGRQLVYGIDHWTNRFDGAIARPAAGHGIAIGDVNGDGLEDVYLCQSPGLPNLLLIQNSDGTVTDTASEAGVNWLEGTRAALLTDLDNDGDQDLVAVLGGKVVIQANDGHGIFQLKSIVDAASSLFAVNAVDYDGDSDLDLFICGYTLASGVNLDDVFANPMPFHDANNGAPNVMLRNDGQWNFTDVTEEVGLNENSMRFSYASAWDDFDNDGDMDVYVANDFGRNNLYRNDGGRFSDFAPELDVEDIGPGMSAAWGDYNNDGHADIYVSNMFSSAGNRITHQQQFKADLDEEEKKLFRRHARGNSLFENSGDGRFRDRSVELGITLGRWAWGSLFVDLNNDGWEDIYVTNGFMTAGDGNDL